MAARSEALRSQEAQQIREPAPGEVEGEESIAPAAEPGQGPDAARRGEEGKESGNGDGRDSPAGEQLSDGDKRQLEELKARDREVRTHEQAHMSAGGQYVRGGPSFTYQRGPDGRQYAIGGEVQLDTSSEDDPQKTLEKAETIRRAALAPAEPSTTDRQVAAQANRMAAEARVELAKEQLDGAKEGGDAKRREGETGKVDEAPPGEGSGNASPAAAEALARFAGVAGSGESPGQLLNLFA